MKIKKLLAAALSLSLVFGMAFSAAACGKTGNSSENPADKQTDTGTEGATDDANAGGDKATSLDFVKKMGNGINLGNTMEAYGARDKGTELAVKLYETSWGQPETTKEMIQGMKNAGFDTIRIPVAWTNAMNYEKGDYKIGDAYLDRVGQLIEWAIEADMYVIVNDHWDGGWWGMFGSATQETRDTAMKMYTEMWTQIADKYKDYDEHLIFESANEELGRSLNDNSNKLASDSGALTETECYETTNKINQTFVDIVRASGGNNAERYLLIAGFNTNIADTCNDKFVMPTDTAEGKLMVSVHYYDPWSYCGSDNQTDWGIKSEYEAMNRELAKLTKFTDKGIGVIIGEYGALPTSDGELKKNTMAYFTNFIDNCDKYNLCPVLWDRSDFYSKKDLKIADSELAAFFAEHTREKEAAKDEAEMLAEIDARMAKAIEDAPKEREAETIDPNEAEPIAWIMWNGGNMSYSVGDKYNPSDCSNGIEASDVKIDGAGTYTVGLDFTKTDGGKAASVTFSALAVAYGEDLYPGYTIDIKEILLNGEPYELTAKPYTASDDKHCTRVNLINEWVGDLPEDAHCIDGDLTDASPVIIDKTTFVKVETLQITFDYVAPAN